MAGTCGLPAPALPRHRRSARAHAARRPRGSAPSRLSPSRLGALAASPQPSHSHGPAPSRRAALAGLPTRTLAARRPRAPARPAPSRPAALARLPRPASSRHPHSPRTSPPSRLSPSRACLPQPEPSRPAASGGIRGTAPNPPHHRPCGPPPSRACPTHTLAARRPRTLAGLPAALALAVPAASGGTRGTAPPPLPATPLLQLPGPSAQLTRPHRLPCAPLAPVSP